MSPALRPLMALLALACGVRAEDPPLEPRRLDFGLEVRQVLPALDGARLLLLPGTPDDLGYDQPNSSGDPARARRLVVWDLERGAVAGEVALPLAARELSLCQGRLIVIGLDTDALLVLDPTTLAVERTVALPLRPRAFVGATPEGALLVAAALPISLGLVLLEVPARGAPRVLLECDAGTLCLAGDAVLFQAGGLPARFALADLRRAAERGTAPRRVFWLGLDHGAERREWAPLRPVAGVLLGSDWQRTLGLAQDGSSELWRDERLPVAPHPVAPAVLVASGRAEVERRKERGIVGVRDHALVALHAVTGRPLWQRTVRFAEREDAGVLSLGAVVAATPASWPGEVLIYPERDARAWWRLDVPRTTAGAVAPPAPAVRPRGEGEPLPLDFGARVWPRAIVPAPDGRTLFVLDDARRNGGECRLLAWDVAERRLAQSIAVPRVPVDMALVGERIVVACSESGVLVIVDPARRAVERTIPVRLDGEEVAVEAVLPDGPTGKLLVGTRDPDRGWLLEVDPASGAATRLLEGTQHVVVAGDHVLAGTGDRGSTPLLHALAELRDDPAARRPRGRRVGADGLEWSSVLRPARVAPGGLGFLCTGPLPRTSLLAPDGSRALWTVDGLLLAVHPTRPLALLLASDPDDAGPWRLRGVSTDTGRTAWEATLVLPARGQSFSGREVALAGARLLPGASGDALVFPLPEETGELDRGDLLWFCLPLPPPAKPSTPTPTLRGEPPPLAEVRAGQRFEWRPQLESAAAAGVRFELEAAPEGVTIDPATGAIAWTPAETDLGRHAIAISVRAGDGAATRLVELVVRVRAP